MALFHVRVNTYLIICRNPSYLLKVIIMSYTPLPLNDYSTFCRQRIDECEEMIKQLRGDTPEGCVITFSLKTIPIVKFEIAENESWFMLSFFMGWLQYYKQELKRTSAAKVG